MDGGRQILALCFLTPAIFVNDPAGNHPGRIELVYDPGAGRGRAGRSAGLHGHLRPVQVIAQPISKKV